MKCKNCEHELQINAVYCSNCGAKVIHNRVTLTRLFSEMKENVFSLDTNKPLKTFIHLFSKPEQVIQGYIDGVRKKYINPFGYFTIAVIFSSIFYFIMLKFFPDIMNFSLQFQETDEAQKELGKILQKRIYENQSLVLYLCIPIFAFISWILFLSKKKHNYAEHLILNL